MDKIDPKKNMAQLLREYPQLARILSSQGIECAECMASQVDTLQDVARMYGLDMRLLLQQIRAQDGSVAEASPGGAPAT